MVFLVLTLLMFNDALFDATKVVAGKGTDLALQFLPWRKFGFEELRHGHLALWNPHIYGGTPYFAGFQSALLYPPNWLHLFLPVGVAINWITALHVFGAGMLTYCWCRYRQIGVGGSILAGVMFMFCGPYFPHIFAGHLPHVAIMIWAPLLFMSIDMVMDGLLARGTLLGVFAMTMFLLAGHPQYVYYTGMAAAVYVLVNLLRAQRISMALAGCALIVIGGMALAAVQLFPGLDFVSESVRSSGTKYEFSASFSFPPENVLTMISPSVFGPLIAPDGAAPPDAYFGRCYLWEVSLFVSVTGVILAVYGALITPMRTRRGAFTMVLICFVFALGAHTPLHKLFYLYLPGFSSFRGAVKFNYLVALFTALLAGYGFDHLLRTRQATWGIIAVACLFLLAVLILVGVIRSSADEGGQGVFGHALRGVLEAAGDANEIYVNPVFLGDLKLIEKAALITSTALLCGAATTSVVILILLLTWIRPRFAYALVGLVMVEMLWFAGSTRAVMNSSPPFPREWAIAINQLPADSRVLDVGGSMSNFGLWFGYNDLWGYDPGVLKRYAELLTRSQGGDPNKAMQYLQFNHIDPRLFPLLRVAAVLRQDAKQPVILTPPPMAVAQLVPTALVMAGRDEILSFTQSDRFDPRHTVLLEKEPAFRPSGQSNSGSVEVVKQSTDSIELVADVNASAMLLITNSYSKGWLAKSIGPAAQSSYEILPADWALQAIALQPGKHHLLLQYRPTSFVIGMAISIVALLVYVGATIWYFRRGHPAK